jgi:putative transposase
MPRIARVAVPEVPYHITQRGYGRRTVFYNDADRLTYLRLLASAAEEHCMKIQAYCLMSNHVHLVAVPQRPDSLARALGRAHAGFARYRNLSDDSCGHVWQARYFSCPLDRAHLWRAIAYVERNPVRAGMVETAEEYRWQERAGASRPRPSGRLSGSGRVAGALRPSAVGRGSARRVRRGGVPAAASGRVDPSGTTFGGRALGSEEFVEQLERQLGRRLRPKPPGRPRKKEAPSIDTAEQMRLEIGI